MLAFMLGVGFFFHPFYLHKKSFVDQEKPLQEIMSDIDTDNKKIFHYILSLCWKI